MKDQWTEINEIQRRYRMPDGSEVVIDNPDAIFISKSRTHYVSSDDDTERIIVPWPFHAIHSKVEDSSDWIYPPPRFDDVPNSKPFTTNDLRAVKEMLKQTCDSGPWAVSDIFQKVPE